MTGQDWVLIIVAVGAVLSNYLTWKANEAAKVRDAAAQAAQALLAKETAAVKEVQVASDAKLADISKATDGTLSALKGQNDTLLEANRRMEQVISTFTALQAVAQAPTPAVATVTNGREHFEPPAEPAKVEVVNLDEKPIPVETVRKTK